MNDGLILGHHRHRGRITSLSQEPLDHFVRSGGSGREDEGKGQFLAGSDNFMIGPGPIENKGYANGIGIVNIACNSRQFVTGPLFVPLENFL